MVDALREAAARVCGSMVGLDEGRLGCTYCDTPLLAGYGVNCEVCALRAALAAPAPEPVAFVASEHLRFPEHLRQVEAVLHHPDSVRGLRFPVTALYAAPTPSEETKS